MQPQEFAAWAQVGGFFLGVITIGLLWWYASETARIRKAEQLANRPFLGLQHEVRHEKVQEIALVVRERPIVLLRNFGRGLATNAEVRLLNLGGAGRTAIRTRTAISPMPYGVTTLIADRSLDDIHGCTALITCSDQGGERLTFWQRGDRTFHGGFEHIQPPGREVQEAIEAIR